MGAQKKDVAEAMNDLVAIRGAIDSVKVETQGRTRRETYVILQMMLVASAVTFCGVELGMDHQMTSFLRAAAGEREFFWYSVAYMAGFLLLVSGTAAMLIARSARQNAEAFGEHVDRHFRPIGNLSLFSDLGLKLVVLTAFLAAGKYEWVAPTLFLFTGDYLIQRRLTTLSEPIAIALGSCAIICGGVQFWMGSPFLIWPLVGFAIVSLISLGAMVRNGRSN